MRDEFEAQFLDDWLHETEITPPDPREGARRVATRLPNTRQVGRWLPFPVLHRKAQSPTATDTAEYQPIPSTATNGRAPTVIGRTHSMFSPVKAITAGALVFALGGLFLVAQPFDQSEVGVPGAQSEGETNGGFTLVVLEELADMETFPGTVERQEGIYLESGMGLVTLVEASDPRLSGTWSQVWNARVQARGTPEDHRVSVRSVRVENEGGTWFGRTEGFGVEGEPFFLFVDRTVLEGQGGYEGLTAIVHWDEENLPVDADGMGVIFDFGMPPQPEAAELPSLESATE